MSHNELHQASHLTAGSDAIQLATNAQEGLASSALVTAIEANTAAVGGLGTMATETATDYALLAGATFTGNVELTSTVMIFDDTAPTAVPAPVANKGYMYYDKTSGKMVVIEGLGGQSDIIQDLSGYAQLSGATFTGDILMSGASFYSQNIITGNGNYIELGFASTMAVSTAGKARLFVDSDDNKLKVSENAGAYVDVIQDLSGYAPLAGADFTGNISFNGGTAVSSIIDDDTMATASNTSLATSESIKAYADAQHADMASGYVSSASASNAITATTYLNVLTNATIADTGTTAGDFTVNNTNKLIDYTGTATRKFFVNISVSFTSTKSAEISRFRIAKNGTTIASTEVARHISTGTDVGALEVSGIVDLATNDTVALFGTLDSSSSNTITVEKANISVLPI